MTRAAPQQLEIFIQEKKMEVHLSKMLQNSHSGNVSRWFFLSAQYFPSRF
jgi:hypothetical protein